MTILWWTFVILLFVLSMVGLFYPIIPSVLALLGGVLIYHFLINNHALSMFFWISLAALTIFLFTADYFANAYFVKKYGGSKWGLRAATIGMIFGCFVPIPLAIIIVPFLFVVLVELIQKRPISESFKAGLGTILGFLGSTFAKGFIQILMIIGFFIDVYVK